MRPLAKSMVGVMFAVAAALVFTGCTGTYASYGYDYGYPYDYYGYDYYDPYYGYSYTYAYPYATRYRYYSPRYVYPRAYRDYDPRVYYYRGDKRYRDRDYRGIRDHRRTITRPHAIQQRQDGVRPTPPPRAQQARPQARPQPVQPKTDVRIHGGSQRGSPRR